MVMKGGNKIKGQLAEELEALRQWLSHLEGSENECTWAEEGQR